jgi:predicted lipid carrier protein YhbT
LRPFNPSSCQGFDWSTLLTFDPASVGARITTSADRLSQPTDITSRLQQVKELLNLPIDDLVKDCTKVKEILDELKPSLPEPLQARLWPAGHLPFFRVEVETARRRIEVRRSQAPMREDMARRCQALNKKKAIRDEKADTSASSQRLDHLEKELADLEAKVLATKQLIADEKANIATSKKQAEDLTLELQAEISDLSVLGQQIVDGDDAEDEAAIDRADQVRRAAIQAIDEFSAV